MQMVKRYTHLRAEDLAERIEMLRKPRLGENEESQGESLRLGSSLVLTSGVSRPHGVLELSPQNRCGMRYHALYG